jgi:hypothetical protein
MMLHEISENKKEKNIWLSIYKVDDQEIMFNLQQ